MVLSGHAAAVFYMILIISSAALLMTLQKEQLSNQIEKSTSLELYEWEDFLIKGEIVDMGKSSSGRVVLTIEADETTFSDGIIWKENYNIRLYADADERISEGDMVSANVRLYEFPEQRNPTQFDYGSWLYSQGISAHGEVGEITELKDSGWLSWGDFRSEILKNVNDLLEGNQASLAKALLLGYKDDLTPEAKQQFSRAGLSHIMAVSGLHVGFIVAPFWLLIPYMWGSNKRKWFGMIVLSLLLISYAGITGFSASVCRASLMAWFLTYGRLFHKVRNSINVTAVAAIILLLIDPGQLFDAGFQLSFSAVFIILLVMPEARRLIPDKYHFGWLGGLITIILVSIVVQIGLFPILANYFGEFSLLGPVSNALVLPFLAFIVPTGIIVILLESVVPDVASIIAIPLDYLLQWIQTVASFTGGSTVSYITLNDLSGALFFIWLFAIFTIASLRIPNIRWKMVICLLLSMNAFMIEQVVDQSRSKKLKVTFLDVGQGDAIHIKTPNEKHFLVDAGRWSPGSNSGGDVILPYLEEMGIDRLDAIFLSHPHADHIGGMVEILNHIKVDTIYQSDVEYDSNLYGTYMELAAAENVTVKYPGAGDIIQLDPSLRIFILGPDENAFSSNPNNRSLAFKTIYGETSILFSGDAEKEQEELVAAKYGEFLKSDIYKVGHHGSNTSSSDSFMRFIKPQITVTSLAFENRFGHPGNQAITNLHQYSNIQNYTSLEGAVVYESDGSTFQKIDWK